MTAMSCECDICDHKGTRFKFGEDIFFADTDGDSPWLCEIGNSSRKESSILDSIEDRENLFSECLTVFSEKM